MKAKFLVNYISTIAVFGKYDYFWSFYRSPTEHSKYVSRNLRCACYLPYLLIPTCIPGRLLPEESAFLHFEIHLETDSYGLPQGINLKVREIWDESKELALNFRLTFTPMMLHKLSRIYYDAESSFLNYRDWKTEILPRDGKWCISVLGGSNVGNNGHEQVGRRRKQWPGWKVGEKDIVGPGTCRGELLVDSSQQCKMGEIPKIQFSVKALIHQYLNMLTIGHRHWSSFQKRHKY